MNKLFKKKKKTPHTLPQGCETPAPHPDKTPLKINASIKCYQQNMTHLKTKHKTYCCNKKKKRETKKEVRPLH